MVSEFGKESFAKDIIKHRQYDRALALEVWSYKIVKRVHMVSTADASSCSLLCPFGVHQILFNSVNWCFALIKKSG